jgi:hypothetical protein
MNMGHIKELVTLAKRKEELDIEMEQTTSRMDELKQMLLPQFLTEACQSMRVDGRLVSITQDVYASPAQDRLAVCKALSEAQLAHFVQENFNTNTLKAYVREIAREIKEECLREQRLFDEDALRAGLPEPLRNALRIGFLHTLRVLKG